MSKRWKLQLPLHLMIMPGLLLILVYQYVPMAGLVIAFMDYVPARGLFGSEWVGWDNFEYVFQLPDIWRVVGNTLQIAVMKIAAGLIFPIIAALLLNEIARMWFKRALQTMIYVPHFMSWIILGGILIDLLSPGKGMINDIIAWLGWEPQFFLGDNRWFPYVLVFSDTWKDFGFNTIVYLAALTAINPDLYEAAAIDGANHWRRTWHITLPGMRAIIILLLTLSLGQVLNAGFEQVYVLYSPQVYESGDIIDTLVYRMGLVNSQFSFATAVGLFKSFVSLLLISISYWMAYRFAGYRIF
ncbi:ABC transporter permease subunit [Paenibacillus sp. J5C_2022]|uniref:ABC transporter permease n=1 Tax=Paenibacillus sp. J5C2022 TaxID=2977129 RepID=UPI0021D37C21|nr:ABC transporter permease subunit [Paenibacillus sp. J5C2022]MCU6710954.1 ABC transporter permease subunit [Paenibacillus sp. J5C2022]